MVRYISTDAAPPPFSRYSQAVAAPPGAELVFVSGQVGVDKEGRLADTDEGQHEQAWRNILDILSAEGLGPRDVLEVTAYVTERSGISIFRPIRDRMLDGALPASTLLLISGLADPAWTVEIAVVAAKAGT